MDKDGTDELYARSYAKDEEYPKEFIECYDLKTEIYSKVVSPDNWKYKLIQYGDNLYIFAVNEEDVAGDEVFQVYELYLSNGQMSYKEIDSYIEQKIIEFISYIVRIGVSGEEGSMVSFSSDTISDISIYDISEEEALICSYTQEDREVMDKIVLFFNNGRTSNNLDIDQSFKGVISFNEEGEEKSITLLFGDTEFITQVNDNDKSNWKNDGLRNYLNYLTNGGNAS